MMRAFRSYILDFKQPLLVGSATMIIVMINEWKLFLGACDKFSFCLQSISICVPVSCIIPCLHFRENQC
jgi:hypothetical protein